MTCMSVIIYSFESHRGDIISITDTSDYWYRKTDSTHPQPLSVSQIVIFYFWHTASSLSFLPHCSCFTLSSLLVRGQLDLGPRWGIAMSFNKQLNSGTHATENGQHGLLHWKKKKKAQLYSLWFTWLKVKQKLCFNIFLQWSSVSFDNNKACLQHFQ